jgi:NAD(P)-dependent dehydrogenase (short-subunit alcohol dehydrogenase family)
MPTIVMTGATAGIGKDAAGKLLARPGTRLIIGARGDSRLAGAEMLPLDLASLASVRTFAAQVVAAVGANGIDALVLNAGGQRSDNAARTVDGYETTFAVNHLAHYLLARLLLPHVADGGRIVITTSDTHDPAEKAPIPPPRHADAYRLAHPETDPEAERGTTAALRAYSTSKLANMMTVRILAALPEVAARRLTVLAYNPGLTPGTGLVRSQPWVVRTLVWPLLPLLKPFVGFMNSLDAAGGALAGLATTTAPPPGRLYGSLRKGVLTWPDPSELARDDAATARLWDDSAVLVGWR